jgi:serine/threonine protein phosphatase PrpC
MDVLLDKEDGRKEVAIIQKEMMEKENGPKYVEESHAGCTANVVLITPEYIYCANAGDSRAVACVNGQVVELSRDHKP